MPRYVALLRGINVAVTRLLAMLGTTVNSAAQHSS
jgi:uncharacterized protein (DUF1697 family)